HQARRKKLVAPADHHGGGVALNFAHIQRLAGGKAETAALADGEAMHTAMFGERGAGPVDDPPGPDARRARGTLDKSRVVAIGNETDLLALGLVRVGESQSARPRAHLGLGHRAERKQGPREFGLGQREKKIRLVLGSIACPEQMKPTMFVTAALRVVP